MDINRLIPPGLILVTTFSLAARAQTPLDLRTQVEQSTVIVVASLVNAEELTANGRDYGRGVLQIDAVVDPPETRPDRLLLEWSNPTESRTSRFDPRALIGQPSLWFLTVQSEGTV